ncbi:Shedu anti-phage system protein SduA domain-containing protein [Kitasatospora sp. NPDC004723]|uniref:Shedu anti-phage system protein SduA domain-containing protein n=1 Tax=Kitasatospora sp. NPDC004723 TaxID=3154288 RepID=UPI0033B758AE
MRLAVNKSAMQQIDALSGTARRNVVHFLSSLGDVDPDVLLRDSGAALGLEPYGKNENMYTAVVGGEVLVILYISGVRVFVYSALDLSDKNAAVAQSQTAGSDSQHASIDGPVIGLVQSQGRLRIATAEPDGTGIAAGHDLLDLIRLGLYTSERWISRVRELEDLINDPAVKENDLQRFFERNPDFLFGDAYQEAYPQLVLPLGDGKNLRPDFGLRPHNQQALCDLLDLKLPTARLLSGIESRRRLSSKVMDAVGQMSNYQRYFDSEARRREIEQAYGLRFYRPRMLVVIGKRAGVDPVQLRQAEADVPNLLLITYDDLLERARAKGNTRKP